MRLTIRSGHPNIPVRTAQIPPDVRWVSIVAVVFIGLLYFAPQITSWLLGTGATVDIDAIRRHPTRFVLASTFAPMAAMILLLLRLVASNSRWTQLRDALTVPPGRRFGIASLFVLLLFFSTIADAVGIWQFAWRTNRSAILFARALLEANSVAAILLWSIIHGLLTPVLEEVQFRFGLLRVALATSGSRTVAVVVTAVLFGALHLGYPFWRPSVITGLRAVAALIVGIGLGALTLASRGRLWPAVVVHAARNLSEVGWLLVSL